MELVTKWPSTGVVQRDRGIKRASSFATVWPRSVATDSVGADATGQRLLSQNGDGVCN